jgi:hypothetical protein
MGRVRTLLPGDSPALTTDVNNGTSLGVIVSDVLYVALTIVVFAVLFLILKGVEHIER